MSMVISEKIEILQKGLQDMKRVVVAFSGGVDSSLLLKIAHDMLGENAIAATAISASLPKTELQEAHEIANWIGASFIALDSQETQDPRYLANAPDRCYFCKTEVYGLLVKFANKNGFNHVLDGTNADDIGDHRPGRQAAREHGVRSPLLEAGLTKEEIREFARQVGLPNWDKPAAACLSSRIPYGMMITLEKLSQVEQAELYLHNLGFRQLRVRHHDQVARIEIDPKDFNLLLEQRDKITSEFRKIGFAFITLDINGFQSGSLNTVLTRHGHR
jgi:uncharacterized protein